MGVIRRGRDAAGTRVDRPTPGRHRGTRKVRRERMPAGGRHARILESAQAQSQPSGTR